MWVEESPSLTFVARTHARRPLYTSAAGKTLLANLPDDEMYRLLDMAGPEQQGEVRRFLAELPGIRTTPIWPSTGAPRSPTRSSSPRPCWHTTAGSSPRSAPPSIPHKEIVSTTSARSSRPPLRSSPRATGSARREPSPEGLPADSCPAGRPGPSTWRASNATVSSGSGSRTFISLMVGSLAHAWIDDEDGHRRGLSDLRRPGGSCSSPARTARPGVTPHASLRWTATSRSTPSGSVTWTVTSSPALHMAPAPRDRRRGAVLVRPDRFVAWRSLAGSETADRARHRSRPDPRPLAGGPCPGRRLGGVRLSDPPRPTGRCRKPSA